MSSASECNRRQAPVFACNHQDPSGPAELVPILVVNCHHRLPICLKSRRMSDDNFKDNSISFFVVAKMGQAEERVLKNREGDTGCSSVVNGGSSKRVTSTMEPSRPGASTLAAHRGWVCQLKNRLGSKRMRQIKVADLFDRQPD